jgi:hypothetical protein
LTSVTSTGFRGVIALGGYQFSVNDVRLASTLARLVDPSPAARPLALGGPAAPSPEFFRSMCICVI